MSSCSILNDVEPSNLCNNKAFKSTIPKNNEKGEYEQKAFKCHNCEFVTLNKETLIRHLRKVHYRKKLSKYSEYYFTTSNHSSSMHNKIIQLNISQH